MHKYRVDSWNIILDMMDNGDVHCAKAFLVSIKLVQKKCQGKRWEDLLEWIIQVKAKDLNDTQIPEHLDAIHSPPQI
jgi:predicted Rossmann fold nucleotide-binding protein DprA/Smf involved in DNA uptake